ncbi:hypothetical protein IT575_11585 [bacterium]|nr:hypothetical protein [bacterium]
MAHAYVPGLKVTELATLRRERILPLKGTVSAQVGEFVNAETIVARTELPGPVKTINVANQLGADPSQVESFMLKKTGESFKSGEVLAQNKPMFGLKFLQSRIVAEFDGIVDNISPVTGQVILRYPPRLVEKSAYVDGKVVALRSSEGVTVETTGTFIQGIFGIGGETSGELKIVVAGPGEVLDEGKILPEHQNKILVGGSLLTAAAFHKARQLGVRGVIVGGFHDKDLRQILGYDLGVAITGAEDLGITLVMTEGFGQIAMADKTFGLLKKREGRKTSISGATQIRAGVIRPEVIIPLSVEEQKSAGQMDSGARQQNIGTSEGDQVRCIREPYFGRIAKVKRLIAEPQIVESETRVRTLEIEFSDGTTAVVPRANIEMIES